MTTSFLGWPLVFLPPVQIISHNHTLTLHFWPRAEAFWVENLIQWYVIFVRWCLIQIELNRTHSYVLCICDSWITQQDDFEKCMLQLYRRESMRQVTKNNHEATWKSHLLELRRNFRMRRLNSINSQLSWHSNESCQICLVTDTEVAASLTLAFAFAFELL